MDTSDTTSSGEFNAGWTHIQTPPSPVAYESPSTGRRRPSPPPGQLLPPSNDVSPATPPSSDFTVGSSHIWTPGSSFISYEGRSPSPAPQQLPPPPPPIPWLCADFWHCARAIGGFCEPRDIVTCPGIVDFGYPTSLTYIEDIEHPDGPETVVTCGHCRTHVDDYEQLRHAMITADADINPFSGYRTQLCRGCIRDEVELYWLRQGQPNPGPAQNSTLAMVRQWPAANGVQDLCICEENSIAKWARTHCHACRTTLFLRDTHARWQIAEHVLRHHNKAVITGKCPHRLEEDLYAPENRVSEDIVARRMANGIGRMCPCGEKPKEQSTPEYITFCMGCSGVRIDPAHLPPELQEDAVLASYRRRQSLRNPDRNTKGPAQARKDPMNRVNTECGWMGPDPWLNGH
ncbi:uncharacterized protein yc1106_08975 [Curvularia clavata]|uniref:Uncharacterized protein n=1 Tax=Curvularia clavata TaxID=95742 RepID=A0A9Q8ZE99_CURCL|nr:uncharacterized protein yc1106_08975 [Curvularia clavata]